MRLLPAETHAGHTRWGIWGSALGDPFDAKEILPVAQRRHITVAQYVVRCIDRTLERALCGLTSATDGSQPGSHSFSQRFKLKQLLGDRIADDSLPPLT
jgi:hypothetical protein